MLRLVAAIVSLVALAPTPLSGECVGFGGPVSGPIIAPFAPQGRYAGHWGVDLAADSGSPVSAGFVGEVAFVGNVVGNTAVTIDHGGGVRSTVSYLASTSVVTGQRVTAGQVVGTSGTAHDVPSVHFSVRIDGEYVDPDPLLACLPVVPFQALRLVP
jgi:murein DD-endopeptidase MepM/ murein hydrolase activator NlpD